MSDSVAAAYLQRKHMIGCCLQVRMKVAFLALICVLPIIVKKEATVTHQKKKKMRLSVYLWQKNQVTAPNNAIHSAYIQIVAWFLQVRMKVDELDRLRSSPAAAQADVFGLADDITSMLHSSNASPVVTTVRCAALQHQPLLPITWNDKHAHLFVQLGPATSRLASHNRNSRVPAGDRAPVCVLGGGGGGGRGQGWLVPYLCHQSFCRPRACNVEFILNLQ